MNSVISHAARFLTRTIGHLAFFALMLSAFAPSAGAFWQCEGRACGVTAWMCCCATATEADNHALECGPSRAEAQAHFTSASHLDETSVCAADCHCMMVAHDAGPSHLRSAHFVHPPISLVAVLPRAAVLEVPAAHGMARPLPSRGPPPNAVYLASPSLRGPPLS